MEVQCVHYSGTQSPSLLFVPGFFTEPLVPGSPLDLSWDRQVQNTAQQYGINGYIVRWPAGNIRDISLFRGAGAAQAAIESSIKAWCTAKNRTNDVIEFLEGHLNRSVNSIHLAGHSLGARIALKVAENLGAGSNIISLTALAPAISAKDLDFEKVASAAQKSPLVCYSSRDRVLSTLFPCGEQSLDVLNLCRSSIYEPAKILQRVSRVLEKRSENPALGLVGVPSTYSHLFDSKDTRLSHMKYASNLHNILSSSRNLNT